MSKVPAKERLSINTLILRLGALILTVIGLFFISFAMIVLTGIFYGNSQTSEKDSNHKPAELIIISSSKHIEEQIQKAQLETPQLPPRSNSP